MKENREADTYCSKTTRAVPRPSYMPQQGVSKHSYLFCQFIDPEDSHKGGHCDCFDTAAQKAKARAQAKLKALCKAKATDTMQSSVPSDPAVTLDSTS